MWFHSNANPANRVKEIFSRQFKQGGASIASDSHQQSFEWEANSPSSFFTKSPRGLSQQSIKNAGAQEMGMIANFLSPQENINRYKAFP